MSAMSNTLREQLQASLDQIARQEARSAEHRIAEPTSEYVRGAFAHMLPAEPGVTPAFAVGYAYGHVTEAICRLESGQPDVALHLLHAVVAKLNAAICPELRRPL